MKHTLNITLDIKTGTFGSHHDLKTSTEIDAQNDYNSDKILYIPIDSLVLETSNYCKFCDGVSFSEEPFTVITPKDKKVECIFRFCPNCGRKLSGGK